MKVHSCVFCGSEDFSRGCYLTMKGVESTMKFQFHGICIDCSSKFFLVASLATQHIHEIYAVLKELAIEKGWIEPSDDEEPKQGIVQETLS